MGVRVEEWGEEAKMLKEVWVEAQKGIEEQYHTATSCNILQHPATSCNILQQTATHWCGWRWLRRRSKGSQ